MQIGAFTGRRAQGDHPEPLQAHDVVDAQAAGMAEIGPQHFDERGKAVAAQPFGGKGGDAPALPAAIEDVRRRTHGQL
ncbi:hypothetical protein D3C75_976610 [compost metagenome]